MIEAKSLYIQALPGTGKTTILKRLRDLGYTAIDGDDINLVFPKSMFPSRGERFAKVMAADNCPDVVLSSYWAPDFKPEMRVFSSLVFGKKVDAWLQETAITRPDLHSLFSPVTLSAWGDSYVSLHERYLNGVRAEWCGKVVILEANQYVGDFIDEIVELIDRAKKHRSED